VEKYYDQNIKNIYKLFISIVNEGQKEIGGNSHVEKYYETLTNWLNTFRIKRKLNNCTHDVE
jgi:hypothetical protein